MDNRLDQKTQNYLKHTRRGVSIALVSFSVRSSDVRCVAGTTSELKLCTTTQEVFDPVRLVNFVDYYVSQISARVAVPVDVLQVVSPSPTVSQLSNNLD